jgi:hypothetical protein
VRLSIHIACVSQSEEEVGWLENAYQSGLVKFAHVVRCKCAHSDRDEEEYDKVPVWKSQ